MYNIVIITVLAGVFAATAALSTTISPGDCDEYINAPYGSIQSPGYPGSYYDDLDCYYTITTSSHTDVTLQMVNFHLESGYDYVNIYDGPTTSSELLGTYTGTQNGTTVYGSSNQVLVFFHTDSSVTNDGFNITFWERANCGEVVFGSYGSISSPGYPILPYPNNLDCFYTITTTPGTLVSFDVVYLNLEPNNDYVDIFDGPSTTSALIDRFTGVETGVKKRASANQISIHFHTNSNNQNRGFYIYFREGDNTDCPSLDYTETSGSIWSPDYPQEYPSNADCLYVINTTSTNAHTQIVLDVNYVSIEYAVHCDINYVEIFDGSTLLARICGSGPVPTIISSTSVLLAHFHSENNTGSYGGFDIAYNTNACQSPSYYNESTGTITSPGYPLYNYPNYANCTYYVDTAEGSQVLFHINSLKLENESSDCPFDHLRIYDGQEETSPIIVTLCGETSEAEYQTTSNSARLEFSSDVSNTAQGFSIAYTTVFNIDADN